ncbi:hypothetical protein [Jannaschia sp. R86511]|uniref:hypothetical protein n=1 Tax=Jannaschia sp. R86511 TaxID=3093853 RepID=UPI0036D2D38E
MSTPAAPDDPGSWPETEPEAEAEEPVEATAPHAVSWLGLFGPDGPAAPGSAPVAPELPGVRVVRLHPVDGGAPSASAGDGPVGLVLAGTVPGRSWLRLVAADQVVAVLDRLADPAGEAARRLAAGRDPGLGTLSPRPAVLVCTDGPGGDAAVELVRRLGAPRRRLLGRAEPRADVWGAGPLGGPALEPSAVLLPSGMVLGGLGPDPAALPDAVQALLEGRPVLTGYRGRSTYLPAEQAAETAVRRHLAVVGVSAWPDDVRVDGGEDRDDGPGRRVLVRHSGGRTFTVLVEPVETELLRAASPGAEPTPVLVWASEVVPDGVPGFYFSG